MEHVYNQFKDLIGEGDAQLTLAQILLRTFIVCILTVALIRLSDRRAYSLLSPFDNVIIFLQAAILGRILLDPHVQFMPSLAGAALISILHRCFAWLAMRSDFFGHLLKGKTIMLIKDGKYIEKNMRKASVSKEDLHETLRKAGGTDDVDKVKFAHMERDGNISVVKKD